jgi:hypothetical protein
MKRMPILLSLIIVMASFFNFSCVCNPSVDDSIVQVWEAAGNGVNESTLLAFGVAVGDGSQILTVLNYEDYTPDGLEVGLPGETKYHASIQAIDPRTSATLLNVEGTAFKAATIGEPDNLKQGDEIVVYGWPGPDYNSLKSIATSFVGYDVALIMPIGDEEYIAYDGSIVTDKSGRVIGLIGTFYNAFVIRLGGPGMTPPIININNALELLLPDAGNQPWAEGPAFAYMTSVTGGGRHSSEPALANYNAMTASIKSLLGTMGESLPASELPSDYRLFIFGPENFEDSNFFSVVYPRPVELRNTAGQVVAEAKWVGLQWDRSEGKSNRLFYGYIKNGTAIVTGGFLFNGNVSALENTLH